MSKQAWYQVWNQVWDQVWILVHAQDRKQVLDQIGRAHV